MGRFPFLGETLAYLKPHKSNSLGFFLQDHCSRYGNVFKSHLFGSPTLVSCDLELNTFILQNEGKLFRSSYPKPVVDILGNLSIMLVCGDLHKKLRSVALSFINSSKSSPLTFYLMLKNLPSIEPEDPLAANILGDFLTFMKGFVSLPLYIYFLANAPSALQKLREENQSLRKGKKDGEPLNWEDYKKMEFTSYVISEGLHCGNLVKFVHRRALKDVQFKDYTIPAGWQVLPVMLATHLIPTFINAHSSLILGDGWTLQATEK